MNESAENKMEEAKLLSQSKHCRLCAEENQNGTSLFSKDESSENLYCLVNRYLPIKVGYDDPFPKTICPGCHIQLEATKLFMELILDGQAKLKTLLKAEQDLLQREKKERLKLEEALHSHNPNASVETYTIQTDESGEKYIIQIYSDGPLFSPEHELALKVEALEKPKRKRGRPLKSINQTPPEQNWVEAILPSVKEIEEKESEITDADGRKRRRIRAPARYEGSVQGKELDNILKKEGVIDEDIDKNHEKLPKTVGQGVTTDGPNTGEIHIKPKPRLKNICNRETINGFANIKRKKKYTCDICKKDFLHLGRYELHKNSHKIRFACQDHDCQVQDQERSVIVEHQNETGHLGIDVIEDLQEYDGTVLLLDSDRPDNDENNLEKSPEADKLLNCPKCEKTFTCKQNYQVHLKAIHDGEKPYKCEICSRTFAYSCSLKCHMIAHRNKENEDCPEKFSCDKCGKVFQHPSSLFYHKDTEHGIQRFVCNKCNRSFKHRQLLQRHQLVHTEDRPFPCTQCHQAFKTKASLINHETVHSGVKRYICPTCGHSFAHKTSLLQHMRWHEGTKPFACDICQKSFSQKGNLAEHKRIHTGEKPYCCDLCGRSFTTSSQWKLHRKKHTGEKPFQCEYCQKRFLHKDTFTTHIRRHLNLRPFKCRHCPRAFSESWACKRHERIHLGEKPYKCNVCDRGFSDYSNLNKHRRTHVSNLLKLQTLENDVNEENVATQPIIGIENVPNVDIDEKKISVEKDELEINSSNLQIQQLLDNEGNTISFTTTDGQPIPIVSSSSEKFQGLMPDGSLVSFDFLTGENKEQNDEQVEINQEKVNLLNTEIQFLEDNSMSGSEITEEKHSFLIEDGKVCFVTSFDENSFLTMA